MNTTETRPAAGPPQKRPPKNSEVSGLVIMLILLAAGLLLFVLPAALGGDGEAEGAGEGVAEEGGGGVSVAEAGPDGPSWVTQDLLPINRYSRPGTALTAVNGVVIHYIGNPGTTAQQNRDYFAGLAESGVTYASSHFIIDTDGSVIQCVPLDEIAYCSNHRNDDTISIEVCHLDDTGEFTPAAYDTLVELLRWLCDTYNLGREEILRHGDVYDKMCPLYYMENPDEWERLRDDVMNY